MTATAATDRNAALLDDFRAGHRPALARAISIVENERDGFEALLAALHPQTGRARRIGVTGPPGAGKSTLTSALVTRFRERNLSVAIVAVDPTSPYTGGALLGDRIRMSDVALDEGVFIRSMATRGSLGGLALSTKEVADVMDAFGFDRVIIETVGVGQSELDIAAAADSTIVVLVPESGDSVQAMKAGLMEIADLFVVNKADRPGAQRLAKDIELTLRLRRGVGRGTGTGTGTGRTRTRTGTGTRARAGGEARTVEERRREEEEAWWRIRVVQTIAETGESVDEVVTGLDEHYGWLEESGELTTRRRARLERRVREVVERRLLERTWREREGERLLEESLAEIETGEATPYDIAARIVRATVG